jgi:predicted ferric reductase
MSIASIPSFRNRLYEIFRIIHLGCSTSICVLLWLHINTADKIARIQAGISLCVWLATYTHRNLLLVYRNFKIGKSRTSIFIVRNIDGTLKVHVCIPRPWRVKPGQYVYLTTARSGFFSILQRHPFMVADSVLEGYDFEMRVYPATGYTRRLLGTSLGGITQLSAFIEGPYGYGFDLRDFGTVVLLASGMGIVGHLPYIRDLVQDYRHSQTKTRDLLLIWSVEEKTQCDLVSKVMTDILREDDLPTTGLETLSKLSRHVGDSSTCDRPGRRPKPHGENASSSLI